MTACFVAITTMAQNTADIEVSYTALSPNFRDGEVDIRNKYILLANSNESKFFSPKTEYLDSLNSTPEGRAAVAEMSRNAALNGKWNDIPKGDGKYVITKSMAGNKLRHYESAGMNPYFCEETIETIPWEMSDSTHEVLGYECVMATADFRGRHWKVWFAPEIPVVNGPWKLGGLPCLILLAETSDGLFSFTATGIQQVHKTIAPVYSPEKYEKVSRTELYKAMRNFIDNPMVRLIPKWQIKG